MAKQFFYAEGDSHFGPSMREELSKKNIKPDTLIWFHDLERWTKAENIEEIQDLISYSPPPLPEVLNDAIGRNEL